MRKTYGIMFVVTAICLGSWFVVSQNSSLQAQSFPIPAVNYADSARFVTSGDNGRTAYVWEMRGTTPVCIGKGAVDEQYPGFWTKPDVKRPASPPKNHLAQ